ncbi:MAG: hypothetical protein EBX41_06935 [Chitinophagia bacterium]|nr:hypothetical protein [Chitinophagia bacterium]
MAVMLYYSHHLAKGEYGNYCSFLTLFNTLSPLATWGLPIFLFTCVAEDAVENLVQLLKKHSLAFLGCMVVISIAFALLLPKDAHGMWGVGILFFIAKCINIIADTLLFILRRERFAFFSNLAYSVLITTLCVGIVARGYSLQQLVLGVTAIETVKCALSVGVLYPTLVPIWRQNLGSLPPSDNKWLSVYIFDMVQTASVWIDKFFVSLVLPASVTAIYYTGTVNIPVLPVLTTAVLQVSMMLFKQGDKEGNISEVQHRSSALLASFLLPVFWYFIIYRHELILFLFGAQFAASVPIFGISCLVLPLRCYGFTSVLQKFNKGHIVNRGAIGELVLATVLMVIFYSLWGLNGMALSFIISTYIQAGYYLYHIGKLLNVPVVKLLPFANIGTKLLLFFVVFYALHVISVRTSSYFGLILGAVCTTVCIGLAVLYEWKTVNSKKYVP